MSGMGFIWTLVGVVALSTAGAAIPFCRWLSRREQAQRTASEKLFWE